MTARLNPFHVGLDRGRRRTLAEIEAATFDRNSFNNPLRRQPVQSIQPIPGLEKVSEWLSRQGVRLGEEDFMELVEPRNFALSQHNQVLHGQDTESTIQRPAALARPASWRSRPATSHTHPSSQYLSSSERKRKRPNPEDSEDDVIIVEPTPSTKRRMPRPAVVIDLTKSARPKPRRSFLGNRDDDVIIIDPPAAEMRRQLRTLVLGNPRSSATPPSRPTQRPLARPFPQNIVAVPEESPAPNAEAAEVSALPSGVEEVPYFFKLATEMREKIYRHLMVSPNPIRVQRLWTEPARRPVRRGASNNEAKTTIDVRILFVCRRTAVEAIRILYSENTFLYLLRDPKLDEKPSAVGARRSQRCAGRNQRGFESKGIINLAKYGHLIRHMAIELEPNRTDTSYEKLMSAALETLAPAGAGSPWPSSPFRPLCGPIHLHTLTITVSPLFESSHRTTRAPATGNQNAAVHDGRFLSMVRFFSKGAPVLKALQRLNVDFLRVHVHVNSDVKEGSSGTASPWLNQSGDEQDSDNDEDSDPASSDDNTPKRRHLETTIDLRYLPRHMEALSRDGLMGQLWANDALMQEKRRQRGAEAEDALAHLRRHLEDACLRPEKALREGIWEDHSAAERRRRKKQAKEEARFDADAYDEESEDDDDDDRQQSGMKSLIISIARVGDELRVYRP